jgi:hypothetical protein
LLYQMILGILAINYRKLKLNKQLDVQNPDEL